MLLRRLLLAVLLLTTPVMASENKITIHADFPGGNVVVKKVEGDTVYLAPDLRGGPAWFYWHFEAGVTKPGSVNFLFASPPMVGTRGPAVSKDGGKSWQWLGVDRVTYALPVGNDKSQPRYDRFTFAFTEAGQKVRFAVAIPYLQQDLDDFLGQHKTNPHLKRSVLTQTRFGRLPVDLLQVGKPGPGVQAVLLTARHHACESMASYVLEGFLREALSESPAAVDFRKRFVLYTVPLVDKDGVQKGDQGKNRLPHDHNRDYGKDSIYPEIKAIQELAELKKVAFSLDLHCPFLRGDIHDAFHFVGLAFPHIRDNLKEMTAWLKEERPQPVMIPLDLLKDPEKPGAVDRRINSHYFATRTNAIFAATLEVPYTQPNCPLDAPMAREYGASLLRAWVRTRFVSANDGDRGDDDHARFLAFRTQFLKTYRSNPGQVEALAKPHLDAKTARGPYRAEANHLMALLRFSQRRFPEALTFAEVARDDANATVYQKATSASLRIQIVSGDPKSRTADVEACYAEWLRLPYPSSEQQSKVFDVLGDYYHKKQDHERALKLVRQQFEVVPAYEKGKMLNRIAMLQDLLRRPEEALESRKEAVKFLRARLGAKPERSVFGACMTLDLFEALLGIPTAPLDEKKTAANMVLDHEIVSAASKEKIRKALAELEKKE